MWKNLRILPAILAPALQLTFGGIFLLTVLYNKAFGYLGLFGLVYSIIAIGGQLWTLGLHEIQYYFHDKKLAGQIHLDSALALVFSLGLVLNFLILLFSIVSGSDYLVLCVTASIGLLAVNKVAISRLNSSDRYILTSTLQTLRAFILFASVSLGVIVNVENYIFAGFLLSEFIIFVFFLSEIKQVMTRLPELKLISSIKSSLWLIPHSVLSDSLIRIDILILSIFLPTKELGVYAFFAYVIEGILQLVYGVRIYLAGKVRRIRRLFIAKPRSTQIRQLIISYITSSLAVCLLGVLVGYLGIEIIGHYSTQVSSNSEIFIILAIGLIVYSSVYPFELCFVIDGKPYYQSVYTTMLTLINISLNFFLIPRYGLVGAAVGTATSLIIATIVLGGIIIIWMRNAIVHSKQSR